MDTMESVNRMLNRLDSWVAGYYKITVDKAASALAKNYRSNIRSGLKADGSPMAPLRPSTVGSPIRRGFVQGAGNQTIRGGLGVTPLSATGETAESIEATKIGPSEWQIASSTNTGDAILISNATSAHSGDPFQGDTPKVIRDPLTVEEKQMDIIENQLVADLERLLQ